MTYPPPPQSNPYIPPNPYDLSAYLAPARKAGLLMIIMGIIGILFSGCVTAAFTLTPSSDISKMMPPHTPHIDENILRITMYIVLGILFITSIAGISIGCWVRGGSKISIVIAIVVTSLFIAYLFINLFAGLIQGNVPAAGMVIVLIAPFILLIVWLIQAVRQAQYIDTMRLYMNAQQFPQQPHAYPGQPQYQYPPPQGFAGYPTQQQQPPQQPPPPSAPQ